MIFWSYQNGGHMRKTVVKKTISLQSDVWDYVSSQAEDNVSAFINEALRDYSRRQRQRNLAKGYRAMASQKQLQEDLALWDTTLMDGLADEDDSAR
jgi:hypothetical protein